MCLNILYTQIIFISSNYILYASNYVICSKDIVSNKFFSSFKFSKMFYIGCWLVRCFEQV